MSIVRLSPLLLLALPAAASAQSMNAEVFYQKASSLTKKGPMALFSSDLKRVINEGKAAGGKARESRLAAVKAGQKPRYCPPKGANSIGSDEYMKGLTAIPAAERARIDMTEATTRILARKFPCPG
jgi:hypothetical protein